MKKLLLIFPLLILSCNEPIVTNGSLHQDNNIYSGHWEIHLTDSLSGSGTIIILQNGLIDNGLIVNLDSLDLIIYISGTVKQDGMLNADFYNNNIEGEFKGKFSNSTAEGFYYFRINNLFVYNGNWKGTKI